MLNERDKKQLQQIAEQCLAIAKAKGATSAEVSAEIAKGFYVETRCGTVDVLEHNDDRGVHITVYRDHCNGSASTTDFSEEALQQTVEAAINIARYTQPDPASGLADKHLMATEFPDLDLYHPWGITPEQAIAKTIECETLARQHDKRITNSDGISLSTTLGIDVYANSHGFMGWQQDTRHTISCSLIAERGDDMQRDAEYTVARDPQQLLSLKKLALHAADNTVARLGSKAIATQKTPVLFRADVARGLLGHFVSAIRGSNLYRRASFLVNKIDHQIFPTWLNLEEHPYLKSALASSAFDSEGVQTRQKYFIEQGILKSYCLDSYSARKLNLQTTANSGGIYNLIATPGTETLDELLKKMDTGLLVTDVMGQGVNITTGDYSRGASGFWVEKGVLQFPVNEITIAGNLKDMFANIVALGNDIDHRGSIQTGSILIDQMMVAGN